jgi:hypothetical protein
VLVLRVRAWAEGSALRLPTLPKEPSSAVGGLMARLLRWAACCWVGGCVCGVAPPSSAPQLATLGRMGQVDEKRVDLTHPPERGKSRVALDGGATPPGSCARVVGSPRLRHRA